MSESEIIVAHHHSQFGISISLQSNTEDKFPCLLCYNCTYTRLVTAWHTHNGVTSCAEAVLVLAVLARLKLCLTGLIQIPLKAEICRSENDRLTEYPEL